MVLPKSLQLLMIFSIVLIIFAKKLKIDFLTILIGSYILTYLFSIIVNIIRFEHEILRILASFNNIAIWILSLILYVIYRNQKVDLEKIEKITVKNYYILFFLLYVSLGMYYLFLIPSYNFFGRSLFDSTWFNDKTTMRFTGLLEYANLLVMFYFLFYPLFLNYCIKMKSFVLKGFLLISSILVIVFTLSRSGYIIFLFTIFLAFILHNHKKNNIKLIVGIYLLVCSSVIFVMFYTGSYVLIYEVIIQLINARDGSNETRYLILIESFNIAHQNSPLIGMGIKSISPFNIPYGSHSTYAGFFYKTGYIGLFIGMAIILYTNIKLIVGIFSYSFLRVLMAVFLLFLSLMLFVEDIDGSNWLIAFYFILLGVVFNSKNWSEK